MGTFKRRRKSGIDRNLKENTLKNRVKKKKQTFFRIIFKGTFIRGFCGNVVSETPTFVLSMIL